MHFKYSSLHDKALQLSSWIETEVNQAPFRLVAVYSLVYFTIVLGMANLKLLWFDEFITFYIARQHSFAAIFDALHRAVDQNPPLTHIVTWWSMAAFGEGNIAFRLPAILFFWAATVALFMFLRKRVPAIFAISSVLILFGTRAFDYAFDERPYALLIAFSIFSLLAWRGVVEGRRPNLAAIALSLCLAAGISSHYYAVLAFVPITVGEAVRTVVRRRIDWRVWSALAAAGCFLCVYLPNIHASLALYKPHAWNKPTTDFLTDVYDKLLEETEWPILAVLALAAAGVLRSWLRKESRDPVLPMHERAAVMVLMGSPTLAYIIAVIKTGQVTERYVLPATWGFAIALAVCGYRLSRKVRWVPALMLTVTACWFISSAAFNTSDLIDQRAQMQRIREHALSHGGTIVVPDSLLVLPLMHYSSPEDRARIVLPIDFDAVHRYQHEDSAEQTLFAGHDLFPVKMVRTSELRKQFPTFTIVGNDTSWLIRKYSDENVSLNLLPDYARFGYPASLTPMFRRGPQFYQVTKPEPLVLRAAKRAD